MWRKRFPIMLLVALLAYCLTHISPVLASQSFVSIQELRDSTPQRLQATYQGRKEVTEIDAPILIPQKDQLPVLNVQYIIWRDNPRFPDGIENGSDGLRHIGFERGYQAWLPTTDILAGYFRSNPIWHEENADNNPYTQDEARRLFTNLMSEVLGLTEGRDYTLGDVIPHSRYYLYNIKTEETLDPLTQEGEYSIPVMSVSQVLHGSMLNNNMEVISFQRHENYAPHIPAPYAGAYIVNQDCYSFYCNDFVTETECLAEDIPLLGWDDILATINECVTTGRISSIDKIELCELALLNTPDLSEDTFRAMPCWKIIGTMYGPDGNKTQVSYINAQTGEYIDPFNSAKTRGCANELITWDMLE